MLSKNLIKCILQYDNDKKKTKQTVSVCVCVCVMSWGWNLIIGREFSFVYVDIVFWKKSIISEPSFAGTWEVVFTQTIFCILFPKSKYQIEDIIIVFYRRTFKWHFSFPGQPVHSKQRN